MSKALLPCLLGMILLVGAPHGAEARDMPGGFADLVEKLSPAVVNISSTQKISGRPGMQVFPFEALPPGPGMEEFRDFFEQFSRPGRIAPAPPREVYSLGSGFIIDASGYVVTNHHVIDDAEEIKVILSDNTKLSAKLVGRDSKTDLALLKVDAGKKLPFVTFGDSDKVRVGDWVLAIGNPFGLGGTVTAGIISARARNINAGPFDDFLQTDAAINRGNSGGPMFNTDGEVIGINTAIFSPSGGNVGIGFAVPTALAKPVIDQLKQFGRTHRGWLGVKIQPVTDEIANSLGLGKAQGALVLEVNKNSPADKVGIRVGDVIVSFDGADVQQMHTLPRMVAETRIGRNVPLVIWRDGKRKDMHITLGELDESAGKKVKSSTGEDTPNGGPVPKKLAGMELLELTPELKAKLNLDEKAHGILVTDLNPDSSAMQQGVRSGDILLQAGNVELKSIATLEAVLKAASAAGRKYSLVRVQREAEMFFITLPTAESKAP